MPVHIHEEIQKHIGKSPEESGFFWSGGPVEVAPRTWFASFFSGVTAFDTDDGLVLVDSGLELISQALAGMIRQKSEAPVHSVIFTQGHVDHAFGVQSFLRDGEDTPTIYAQRDMPARFERYERTNGHNRAINARQFGGTVDLQNDQSVESFRTPKVPPNSFFSEAFELEVGGTSFEVHPCRGETDDHCWVYCPERGVLCPGDLFIWAVPNAGNPQKVQRYPEEWAQGLRAMAAKKPKTMCPGHGGPIIDDAELVQRMLTETADFLESIVEQTIAALNDGSPPHVDIIHRVELPKSDSPWLRPLYDEAEFIVRNVIRRYGGWWSGRPSELEPPTRDALAKEVVALAGGVGPLLDRAESLLAAGDLRVASSLADYAMEAEPDNKDVQDRVAALYLKRAELKQALMPVNLYSSAAAYAKSGRPFK